MALQLDRRQFLGLMASVSSLPLLYACGSPRLEGDYFDMLRETRRRIRTSPDYVSAQLDQLAESGDIDGLVHYIRKHFAVLPPDRKSWASVQAGRRWGSRGVMRARAGTPREIANLLLETVKKAGIDARLVLMPRSDGTRDFLINAQPPEFAPRPGPDDIQAWSGAQPSPDLAPADMELAERITRSTIAALDMQKFRPAQINGQHLALPDVEINGQIAGLWSKSGSSYRPQAQLNSPADEKNTPDVRFTLTMTNTTNPDRKIELVDVRFSQEDLAGRRVDISFVPPAARMEDLLMMRPADVTSVVPVIGVSGLDMTDEDKTRLIADGAPFTIEGEVFEEADDGFILGERRIGSSGNPAQVQGIRIRRVLVSQYPKLSIEFDALDAEGAPVSGVSGRYFSIEENGEAKAMLLRSNLPPAPAIIFLLDKSSSVPPQFRDEGAKKVVTSVARQVRDKYPDAKFRVALVGTDGAGILPWQADLERLGKETGYFTMGSGLWHAYADAAIAGGNLVVFLTDGVAADAENALQDTPPTETLAVLNSGPPAIMLGSGDLGPAFEGIAAMTGGVALSIDDSDAASTAVLEAIDQLRPAYNALVMGDVAREGENRELRLSLANSAMPVEARASYEVPAVAARGPGSGVAALFLRIEANGVTCERILAGTVLEKAEEYTPEHTEDVRQALFGRYAVITEAGDPSPSQILDEILTSRLSHEAVLKAKNTEDAIAAMRNVYTLPHGAFTFSVPVTAKGSLTWDTGLRMWLSTERMVSREGKFYMHRAVDLLPVTRFMTSGETSEQAIRTTMARTSTLAAIEAAIYEDAAAYHIDGPLKSAGQFDATAQTRMATRRLTNGWPVYFQFAFNPEMDAGVAVDRETGTLIAIASDGTGGAITEEEIKRNFDQIIALVEMSGSVGVLSAWAKLEKAKLENLRDATLIIHRMSVQGIIDLLHEESCKMLGKEATAGGLAGIRRVSPLTGSALSALQEALKRFKRWSDAAGLPPGISTYIKPC